MVKYEIPAVQLLCRQELLLLHPFLQESLDAVSLVDHGWGHVRLAVVDYLVVAHFVLLSFQQHLVVGVKQTSIPIQLRFAESTDIWGFIHVQIIK